MLEKNIIGIYNQLDEATTAVQTLLEQGVEMEDIHVVASPNTLEKLKTPFDKITYIPDDHLSTTDDRNQNFVSQIKDFFSLEPAQSKQPAAYRDFEDDIMAGAFLLVCDRKINNQLELSDPGALGPNEIDYYKDTIKLHQERLHVSRSIQARKRIHIEKKVVEESRLIEVPILREELHVTEIELDENGMDIPNALETTVYPLAEENIQIFAEPYVSDLVEIEKKVYKDIETIHEKVLSEELVMDQEGHPQGLQSDQAPSPYLDQDSTPTD